MITLRPYQKEPIRKAIEFFRESNPEPALMVMPTGWGKSLVAAECAAACPDPILVVQPSKELLEQNLAKYRLLCGDLAPAGVYSASFGKKQIDHVTFATIGSIKEIGATFKELGFRKMLIDEAHLYPRKERSMLGQFLKDSGIHQVLGITATPLKLEQFTQKQGERFDKWSELIMLTNPSQDGSFFKRILHVSQIQEIVSLGYWSPLKYEIIPFDKSMLHYNSTGGEYTMDSIERAYALNNVRENIYAALDWHRDRKHCLVFVPSVEEAAILASDYPGAAVVSGETPKKERAAIINAFKEGLIRVIYNVGVLSCGFDYPKIDLIILAFSTSSVGKFYQIAGRGVRVHPDKKDCVIVDMGGNFQRFGKVEDIRFDWQGKWRMFGTGGKLLTGLPINCVGAVDRTDVDLGIAYGSPSDVMSFGKHRGNYLRDVPVSYLAWSLANPNLRLGPIERAKICAAVENHLRDTRNDPPMDILPDGQHAGEHIGMVPRGYLSWYYKSKEWNETNDSLRRGLEFFLSFQ